MERYILEIPNLVPKVFCDHLIKKFENDPGKYKGTIGSNTTPPIVNENLKKSVELSFSRLSHWEKEDAELAKYIASAVSDYINTLKHNFSDKNNEHIFDDIWNNDLVDSGFTIQRIDRGDKYAWHHDGPILDSGKIANIILYLNTLDSSEGGTTELINGRKIRPEAGKVLIFPASWTFAHCGNVVKAPHKYICCSLLLVSACLVGNKSIETCK
jgi:hypothetical protein